MDIRHIDTHLFVLLRLDTLGECHGLSLHLTVGIECADRSYPFIRRQDGGKTAVRIILELLDGNTASETTAVGQFPGMVEEIAVTFVVGNTTVVGKRLGIAEWHDFSRIFPRTGRRGCRTIGDMLRDTTGGIQQLVGAVPLGEPRSLHVAVLILFPFSRLLMIGPPKASSVMSRSPNSPLYEIISSFSLR